MWTRRDSLRLMGAGLVTVWAGMDARVALAAAETDRRFVVVILRGALDGLAAVPPVGDPDYTGSRGGLAFASAGSDGALALDGFFALNPALAPLQAMYQARELLVFHAVATPYRARSHFDGQDLLENGTITPHGTDSGWLNRALAVMGGNSGKTGLAVGQSVPLMLRGPAAVGAYAPRQMPELAPDFLQRLEGIYRGDALFAPALAEGMAAETRNDEVLDDSGTMAAKGQRGSGALKYVVADVGKLMAAADGPRVAVMDAGGWDTHVNQGLLNGRLAVQLKGLGESLAALKDSMGPAWHKTAVAVVTEFGRTVAENGTGGTDHGTAGIAFLLGGAVTGGRVVARWPGLAASALYQDRDLAPTLDLRSVMKTVLAEHLELPEATIERGVFPDSAEAKPLRDLVRV